jgi:hypothetical protein
MEEMRRHFISNGQPVVALATEMDSGCGEKQNAGTSSSKDTGGSGKDNETGKNATGEAVKGSDGGEGKEGGQEEGGQTSPGEATESTTKEEAADKYMDMLFFKPTGYLQSTFPDDHLLDSDANLMAIDGRLQAIREENEGGYSEQGENDGNEGDNRKNSFKQGDSAPGATSQGVNSQGVNSSSASSATSKSGSAATSAVSSPQDSSERISEIEEVKRASEIEQQRLQALKMRQRHAEQLQAQQNGDGSNINGNIIINNDGRPSNSSSNEGRVSNQSDDVPMITHPQDSISPTLWKNESADNLNQMGQTPGATNNQIGTQGVGKVTGRKGGKSHCKSAGGSNMVGGSNNAPGTTNVGGGTGGRSTIQTTTQSLNVPKTAKMQRADSTVSARSVEAHFFTHAEGNGGNNGGDIDNNAGDISMNGGTSNNGAINGANTSRTTTPVTTLQQGNTSRGDGNAGQTPVQASTYRDALRGIGVTPTDVNGADFNLEPQGNSFERLDPSNSEGTTHTMSGHGPGNEGNGIGNQGNIQGTNLQGNNQYQGGQWGIQAYPNNAANQGQGYPNQGRGQAGGRQRRGLFEPSPKAEEEGVLALLRAANALRRVDDVLQRSTMFWRHICKRSYKIRNLNDIKIHDPHMYMPYSVFSLNLNMKSHLNLNQNPNLNPNVNLKF